MGKSKKKSNYEIAAEMMAQVAQQNAAAESNRIAQETQAQAKELATIQQNMTKNLSADLSAENRAVVEVAGAANDADTVGNPDQKRKRTTGGLASSLGIT